MKSPENVRRMLWALLVLTTAFSFLGSLQGLMFPLLIGIYLKREPLKRFFSRFSLPVAFVGAGLGTGLLIELLAIADNWELPDAEKVLLHPNPLVDMLIACFWYGFFSFMWYLILRKVHFSKKAVYILSSLYGILTEFGMLALIIGSPLVGGILAIIVTAAYGIFPLVAYLLTEEQFGVQTHPNIRHYALVFFAFLVFWVFIGNLVYNPIVALFPKGF